MALRSPHFSGIVPPPRLLASARVLAGLTQADLASLAGIATTSVARYEAGSSRLRSDSLDAILAVLLDHGVQFLGGDDEVEMGAVLLRRRKIEPK